MNAWPKFDIFGIFLHGGVAEKGLRRVARQGKFSRILIQHHGMKITEE